MKVDELAPIDPRKALRQFPTFFNDLETSAFRLEPRLVALRDQLRASFQHVYMTGSGTAFFCLEGTPEPLPGVAFFPFRSIHRNPHNWYNIDAIKREVECFS